MIELYIDSQKRWITKLLARRQVNFCSGYIYGDVIDVGCGLGILEAAFSESAKSFRSCDIKDYNMFGIKVDICEAENLPYKDNGADRIFMVGVLEHFNNPEQATIEARRVLRRDGMMIVTIPNGFLWKIIRMFWKSDNIIEHTLFNENNMRGFINGMFTITRKVWMIPGLVSGYTLKVIK